MSLGFYGKCRLIAEDEKTVVYSYSGENTNDPLSSRGDIAALDGCIIIQKSCLEEPEIHKKIRKMPSGRKQETVKRIVHTPSIDKHLCNGDIRIEKPCKNEFARSGSETITHYLAYRLLIHLFESYQRNGYLPKEASFIQ